MEITDELLTKTEEMQNEMHSIIAELRNKHPFSVLSYDDLVHVYTMMRIARLEIMLDQYNTQHP